MNTIVITPVALALGALAFSTFPGDETLPAVVTGVSITLSAMLIVRRTLETAQAALRDRRPIRQNPARTALAAGGAVATVTLALGAASLATGTASQLTAQMTVILAVFLMGFTTLLLHRTSGARPPGNQAPADTRTGAQDQRTQPPNPPRPEGDPS